MIGRVILALAASALPLSASAIDYHLSDCQPGADAACQRGDDAWDGLAPTHQGGTRGPKRTWAGVKGLVKKGNRFLFAQGGAWDNAGMSIYAAGSVAGDSVTWDAYLPSWCVNACRNRQPWLRETRPGVNLFNFDDGNYLQDGGYVVRNLKLDGGGTGARGILFEKNVDDVLLERLTITNFAYYGIHSSQNPESRSVNRWSNDRITLRDSALSANRRAGWIGGGTQLVIENVSSDRDARDGSQWDHPIYLSDIRGGVVRGLRITNPTPQPATGKCGGSAVTLHGVVTDLVFENIQIVGSQAGATPHCYGFDVSQGYWDSVKQTEDANHPNGESMRHVTIRGVRIANVGYIGIGVRSCQHCVIENNEIVWTTATAPGVHGINTFGGNAPKGLDVLNEAITIRNNSVYFGTPHVVVQQPVGLAFSNEGANHAVTNNIVVFGPGSGRYARCHDMGDLTLAHFRAWDHNLCHRADGPAVYSKQFATLAQAQAAGWDVHGLAADPLLAQTPAAMVPPRLDLQQASPALHAGHQAERSKHGAEGRVVWDRRDIGARQFGNGLPAPLPPARLQAQ